MGRWRGFSVGLTLLAGASGCGGTTTHNAGDDVPGAGATAGAATTTTGATNANGASGPAPYGGASVSPIGGAPASFGGATGGAVSTPDTGSPGPANLSKPWPSSGCGLPLPAEQETTIPGSRTGYTESSVNETGATLDSNQPGHAGPRQFFVRVPADYDPNRPYRVVYLGSGCGAQRAGKTNTSPLFDETRGGSEQAVYVALSVPDNDANPGCYDNNAGPLSQEWETFDLIHTFVEQHYCVDNNRIFVSGYSTGGWLANMWGCYFGGTPTPPLDSIDVEYGRTQRKFSPKWAIRGHSAVASSLAMNQPLPCNGPAAGLWIHDDLDKSNLVETETAALNLALKTNGCQGDYVNGPKQPWAPAEDIPGLQGGTCQEYTGCPADIAKAYPLIFCTTSGRGHSDQQPAAIPAFTAFFNLMDPTP